MILQLALVVVLTVSFFSYIQKDVRPTKVYVFNKDLPSNTKITKDDINEIEIPEKGVSSSFVLQPNEIIGKYTAMPVIENQNVYKGNLKKSDEKDPFEELNTKGLRKISLPISYDEGFGGELKRGDKIDLVFSGQGSENGTTAFYSKVFLQDVLIHSVNTSNGYKYLDHSKDIPSANEEGNANDTGEMSIITLIVTPEQAEEIKARNQAGTITYLARFQDSENKQTAGYTLNDRQYKASNAANDSEVE